MRFSQVRPFQKLLVPVDFSDLSIVSVHYAVSLAKALHARILLFHVIHIPLASFNESDKALSTDQPKIDAIEELKLFRDKMVIETAFVDFDIKCSYGLAVDAICDAVIQFKVDLLIMGTGGASGLDELLLGSNTAAVTERCSCPVLSVPAHTLFKVPKHIFFATNFTDNDFQSIFLLTQFFKIFRPEITIGHVEEKHSHKLELDRLISFQDQVRRNIAYDKLSFVMLRGDSVKEALNEHLVKNNFDLIATSIRHRNLFEKLTSRSLTKKLVNHVNLPLIAFHTIKKPAMPLF